MDNAHSPDCRRSGDTLDPTCPACARLLIEGRTEREPGSVFHESSSGGFVMRPGPTDS
jgi:hypothetical protein